MTQQYPAGFGDVQKEYAYRCVGGGWRSLIDEAYATIEGLDIRVIQVKEKFGGLRFYISPNAGFPANDNYREAQQKIDLLEAKSYTMCEACGKFPIKQPKNTGWIRTLCAEHWKERELTTIPSTLEIADAIEKNGYPQGRGTFVDYAFDDRRSILAACAIGQAGLNLTISPQTVMNLLNNVNIRYSCRHDSFRGLGELVIHLNDTHRISLKGIAKIVRKYAKAEHV